MVKAIDWEVVLETLLAMALGGIIGLEREIGNQPAGFRTHMLVCMGSALVMMTAEYLFDEYHTVTNMDPGRLSAQVISGIGFIGAGAIMKDGFRIRGLTTAASLWVVACIGLAIGVGFYWGAVVATFFSYVTLFVLKKFEAHMSGIRDHDIVMDVRNVPEQMIQITNVLAALNVKVRHVDVAAGDEEWTRICFKVVYPPALDRKSLIGELYGLDDVRLTEEDDDV